MSEVGPPKPFLSLVIPAYNEEARMARTLEVVSAYLDSLGKSWEIIVVDDGSTDGTLRVLQQSMSESVRVISREVNRGKGYTVREGMLAAKGVYVGFSDADLSAPIDELAKLIEAMERGYDVAIGSRAVAGAIIPVHQPLYRELGGKGLNLLIRLLAVPGIHDTQCGFKLFTSESAREVFSRCFIDGWGFDVEALYLARRLGYTIAEIGVRWSHAEGSKLRPFRGAMRVLYDILRMRAHHYDLR